MASGQAVYLDPSRARFLNSPWHSFGQRFEDLTIYGRPAPFPVVNERAVRATAGIIMVLGLAALALAFFNQNFWPIRILTVVVAADFALRQLTGLTPLSPFGILGTLLVMNQRPEWVGTTQKRFAWALGFMMAAYLAVLSNLGIHGLPVLGVGLALMSLLWLESVVGLCVGCRIYGLLIKMNLAHPEDAPACAGGICEIRPANV